MILSHIEIGFENCDVTYIPIYDIRRLCIDNLEGKQMLEHVSGFYDNNEIIDKHIQHFELVVPKKSDYKRLLAYQDIVSVSLYHNSVEIGFLRLVWDEREEGINSLQQVEVKDKWICITVKVMD